MEFKELKQGMLIKWRAERKFSGWNTFGKVISITEDEVTVLTFDDFKETTLNKSGEAVKEEIVPANKDEVSDYFELRRTKLNSEKAELAVEHRNQMRHIDGKISKLVDCEKKYLGIAN